MAYRLRVTCNVDWVGDGAGGMTPQLAQTVGLVQNEIVPGGSSQVAATLTTNLNLAVAQLLTDLEAQLAGTALLTQLVGWQTGGG